MAEGGGGGGSGCVLVVESNEGVQRLVHVWLASRSIEHTQVLDAQHAVAACAQVKYAVIFIDIDLLNGTAAATNIRCVCV